MDWMTFIVELSKALGWPLAFLAVVFSLKNHVTQMIPRLKKLKHKDTELEFFQAELKELEAEKPDPVEALTDVENVSDLDEKYEVLSKLSDLSPRLSLIHI